MTSSHPKWSFKEFSAFLLLHAANADQVITPEEKLLILEKISSDQYASIFEEYDNLSDSERESLLQSYKGIYFPTLVQKEELLDMLIKAFIADGEFSASELQLFQKLENLL